MPRRRDRSSTGLSSDAKALLARLQTGSTFAVPSVYPSALAFNDHAIAFLNNAAAMCRTGDMDDFRIFGALYCMRHGLELWVKGIVQNATIDKVIDELVYSSKSLADIMIAVDLKGRAAKQLEHALCVLRNATEDGLKFPENHERNMGTPWAERAIALIRKRGELPRYEIGTLWSVPVSGHGLTSLWQRARADAASIYFDVAQHARYTGEAQPMTPEHVGATCELLDRWDADGDAFRYPSSLDGDWHFDLPHLNLERLGALADELESTVRAYDSFMQG
jgi:hypothetical protein